MTTDNNFPESYVRDCLIEAGSFVWPTGSGGPVLARLEGCAILPRDELASLRQNWADAVARIAELALALAAKGDVA